MNATSVSDLVMPGVLRILSRMKLSSSSLVLKATSTCRSYSPYVGVAC